MSEEARLLLAIQAARFEGLDGFAESLIEEYRKLLGVGK